jgi:hypothetical protein
MNTIKPIYISAFAFLALVGCGTAKQVTSAKYVKFYCNNSSLNIKKKTLAENDLKRWSHLDIVTDTIPE